MGKSLSTYTDEEGFVTLHEAIRESFTWGIHGKSGDQSFTRVLLKDMSKDHIIAILRTQYHITEEVFLMFIDELMYRNISGV